VENEIARLGGRIQTSVVYEHGQRTRSVAAGQLAARPGAQPAPAAMMAQGYFTFPSADRIA
jgi:hypothetical protein